MTGGLSCGKSSVCRLFKDLGAYVCSADEIVHQLLSPEKHLGQEVIKLIGIEIVVNNRIDRNVIAKKVFDQPKLLQALEKLLHPAVYKAIESQYESLKGEGKKGLFVIEIPLLFESEHIPPFDATIAVVAPETLCIERFQKGEEEYRKRMSRQLSPEEKARRATYVIHNDGSWDSLRSAVANIYHQLTI